MILNLPTFPFSIKETNGKKQIYDSIRKRFVAMTPEEWVRQHIIRLLIEQYGVPAGLMGVEQRVKVGVLSQRADIVVYNRSGQPILIVEVKSPNVAISQEVLDQASRYNIALNVKFLILSNGLNHLILRFDSEKKAYEIVAKMPQYTDM